jgi:hypothetical protein
MSRDLESPDAVIRWRDFRLFGMYVELGGCIDAGHRSSIDIYTTISYTHHVNVPFHPPDRQVRNYLGCSQAKSFGRWRWYVYLPPI